MTERSTIRLHPPVILWWVWVAFVALNVVDYAVQGLPSARFALVGSALLLLVTGLFYTLALRPRVIEDGDGLTVVNPFRVHRLPWPVIESVGTGEWVRVRYSRGGQVQADGPGQPADATAPAPASAVLNCWALYVSARARRKIAAGPARGPDPMSRRLRGLVTQPSGGYAQDSARLPGEARYLASLPVSAAIARRLDTRADRERARAAANPAAVATTWSWPALAAVAVPAALLLAVALA